MRLISGIILWITFSYILYAFFYFYREAFRILTGELGGQILLILDEKETFQYNLFYSSLASSIGYMFSLRFVLSNSVSGQPFKTRTLIRRTLNDESFFTWSFLLWFGKVTSMLGIWYIIFPMQFDIDFLKEFPLLLILLPLTVFLSTWPKLSRIIRNDKFKWIGISFGLFMMMSFAFAFKNFMNTEKINRNILKNSIEYTYDLKVPKSQSHQWIQRKSLVTDIYLVRDTINELKPLIYFGDVNTQVALNNIAHQLNIEKDKLSEIERDQLIANLHIDRNISMNFINKLKYQFRKANFRNVQYSTGRKYSKYPSNYALFKYSGIQHYLNSRYYPEFEDFLDSAENLDFSKHAIRIPESQMYRVNALKEYNRIAIHVDKLGTTLNNRMIAKEELERVIYKFIKRYSPNFVIIYNADDNITYYRYIENLDLIYTQIDRLRNEMSLKLYEQPFDYWYWGDEMDSIKSKYPRNIVEWTQEEKRLIELMKKAGNNSYE